MSIVVCSMYKFAIVSNRLPISVSKKEGKLEFSVSSGGLATAMSSLDVENQIWIGWPGIASDDLTPADKTAIKRELAKYNCYPIHLTADQVENFYEGYSNDTLWPLFHYFQAYTEFEDSYWKAYQQVNKLFLRAIEKTVDPFATVWVQDYHLMLLPAMIRAAMPQAHIGFFLHIPFPSYEIFRFLPERKEILDGLLGADLLGFHIYDYAQYFINSCNHLLGTSTSDGIIEYQGRQIKVDAFPIGIDYAKFRQALDDEAVKKEINMLSDHYKDQKIILSVDRLDYSKGILKRLEAYDLFLSQHPEYHKKVTLIVVAVPSRTEVETYKKLRDQIEQAVSRINGTYSTSHWSAISYQFKNLAFNEVVALYAKSDVALVTPLRDGMNLVAKEYVASKRGRAGVLVLSELAGAADELTESILVNPNNITKLAQCIYDSLTMPKKEQFSRLQMMQKRISTYTLQKWSKDFIQELGRAGNGHVGTVERRLSRSQTDQIVRDFKQATSRSLLLDYDGTLKHFSTSIRSEAATPSVKLKHTLSAIASTKNTSLYIISGRLRHTLDKWFKNIPNIKLVAEHGAWIKENGEWSQIAKPFDKSIILRLMNDYALRTAGAIVEEKEFSVVWHYRGVTPELAYVRNRGLIRDLTELLDGSDLAAHKGNKIIEVKPKVISKGSIVKRIARANPTEFTLCAGDDYTDEDMFKSLPASANTIKVGYGRTAAKYQVGRLERIVSLLERLP